MAYAKQGSVDWTNKERRELFAKATNSILMTTPEIDLDTALEKAKKIVDTAFTNYPDRVEEQKKKIAELTEEPPVLIEE
ncbi:MAG: hypothetical protein ACTSPI_16595 [Candidatus Heimdallarchaeaceae archaeon]